MGRRAPIDITGQRFGRWTVLRLTGWAPKSNVKTKWLCRCDCGVERPVFQFSLRSGDSTSCGCYHNEISRRNGLAKKGIPKTHGKSGSRIYQIWADMIRRCEHQHRGAYKDYGGRGIRVCIEWKSFENFYRDMGDPPSDLHTIDRIDNNSGYFKENCRWADEVTQGNNRRNNRRINFRNQTFTIAQASRKFGINRKTLSDRLDAGAPVDDALFRVVRK